MPGLVAGWRGVGAHHPGVSATGREAFARPAVAGPSPCLQRPLQERRDVPPTEREGLVDFLSAAAAWATRGRCALARDHATSQPCLNGGTCDLLLRHRVTSASVPRAGQVRPRVCRDGVAFPPATHSQ